MKVIFSDYFNKLRSTRAVIHKMTTSVSKDRIDPAVMDKAEDFLEMYKKFTTRVVGDEATSQLYNGDFNRDIYKGSHGNTVTGLIELKAFGNEVASEITKCVTKSTT